MELNNPSSSGASALRPKSATALAPVIDCVGKSVQRLAQPVDRQFPAVELPCQQHFTTDRLERQRGAVGLQPEQIRRQEHLEKCLPPVAGRDAERRVQDHGVLHDRAVHRHPPVEHERAGAILVQLQSVQPDFLSELLPEVRDFLRLLRRHVRFSPGW